MGKRIKSELDIRGMKPVDLCAMVPDMDVRTLSALYTRDSRNSKFAPKIAQALGVELIWLITGEGEKYQSGKKMGAGYSECEESFSPCVTLLPERRQDDHPAIAKVIKLMLEMDSAGKWMLAGKAEELAKQNPKANPAESSR